MTAVAGDNDPYEVEFKGWDAQDDDLLRDDIPGPNTTAFGDAFQECYIEAAFDTGKNQPQCRWHYVFANNFWNWVNYVRPFRGTAPPPNYPEDAHYWTVYIMAVYDCFDANHDNDPDGERGYVGVTFIQEPEYSSTFEETFRDLRAQHGWTEQELQHARAGVVLHEIGLHFELAEAESGAWDHVMRIPTNDAEESNLKSRTNSFKASDIAKIRATELP